MFGVLKTVYCVRQKFELFLIIKFFIGCFRFDWWSVVGCLVSQ